LDKKRPGKAKSLSQVLALSGQPPASAFSYLRMLVPLQYLDSLLNTDYEKLIGFINPVAHLEKHYERLDRGDIINTILAVDRETFLPDDLLFKIDIATMAHGLEARSPLLDHHLVAFMAGLPGNMKLRQLKKKYIFKQALKDVLPVQVLTRRKRGFDVPVSHWLKSELQDACRDALSPSGLIADIFETNKLKNMFKDHLSNRKDWGRFFWMILMLHSWSKVFLRDGTACQK
jgi:asparagine synthase (glutamine-hydrolysing)